MKKPSLGFLSLLAMSFVAACSGGNSAAGHYEIDKVAMKETVLAAMPAEAKKDKKGLEMADTMVAGMNVSIDLKADGTAAMSFKMDFTGQKREDSETGTWKLDGNKLSLTTKDKAGKDETKTAELANGSFTIEHEEGGQKMKMTFKKK